LVLVRNEIAVCSARSQRMPGTLSGFSGSRCWDMKTSHANTPSTALLSRKASA
jgi:hypothetical protein